MPPTPAGPWEGLGAEWRRLRGPARNDFPGPAAVIADGTAHLEPDLLLGPTPACGSLGPPSAVILSGASGELQVELDAALQAGAHLVVLDPSPSPEVTAELVLRQRRSTCATGNLAHIGVVGALGAPPPSADLVVFEAPADEQTPALTLAARVLRARGQRAVIRGRQLPPPAQATHLILGGGLWLEPGATPDPLLAFARAHRDLIGLPTARVALLHGAGDDGPVATAAAQLEAAHVQFEVVGTTSTSGPGSRLDMFDLLVSGEGLSDPNLGTRIDEEVATPEGALPARVRSDLPATVLIERHKLPGRNALVHHLVQRSGEAVTGRTLHVPAWVTGPKGACAATWYTPEASGGASLPCAIGPERDIVLSLPTFATWGIVLTEPRLPAPPPLDGSAIRLRPEDPMPGSFSLQLDVPGWAPGVEEITLFLPERLEADGGPAEVSLDLHRKHHLTDDGTVLTATAEGAHLGLRIRAQGRKERVDITIEVENVGPQPLTDVRALVCLESKPSGAFPREGHQRTWTAGPKGPLPLDAIPEDHGDPRYREIPPPWYGLTMLESIDENWVMGQVFEDGAIVGGNAGRTHLCVHSRPLFGDLAPGQTSLRKGRILLSRDSVQGVQASYEADPIEPLPVPPPPPAVPYRLPCR